jgi:hypothetical protein
MAAQIAASSHPAVFECQQRTLLAQEQRARNQSQQLSRLQQIAELTRQNIATQSELQKLAAGSGVVRH